MNQLGLPILVALLFMGQIGASENLPSKIFGLNVLTMQELQVDIGANQAMVVVFLSARCPCSNSHIDELKLLNREYPEFKFLGVHSNQNENRTETSAYFKAAQLPFVVLHDSGAKIADQFKALKTPHAFIVDSKSKILFQGGVSNSHIAAKADRKYLREALADIRAKRPIKTAQARAVGCAIIRGVKSEW